MTAMHAMRASNATDSSREIASRLDGLRARDDGTIGSMRRRDAREFDGMETDGDVWCDRAPCGVRARAVEDVRGESACISFTNTTMESDKVRVVVTRRGRRITW